MGSLWVACTVYKNSVFECVGQHLAGLQTKILQQTLASTRLKPYELL